LRFYRAVVGKPPDPTAAARQALETETRRVADRLRVLGEARTGPHLAILRVAAQDLIDCSMACEHGGVTPKRPQSGWSVPQVDTRAWADVITVLANDVLVASGDASPEQGTAALSRAAEAMTQLRRAL
jgi:hypothetical protein